MDTTAIKRNGGTSPVANRPFVIVFLTTLLLSSTGLLSYAGYKCFFAKETSGAVNNFTAEVMAAWRQGENFYITIRTPDERITDVSVPAGLHFATHVGDTVFGTGSKNKFVIEGIRRVKEEKKKDITEMSAAELKMELAKSSKKLTEIDQRLTKVEKEFWLSLLKQAF